MPTLYLKYRPRNFTEIVNQNHIKITLQSEIETDSLTHAYLFCGPRGTGKTTMARVFAKSLNCEKRKQGTSEPCDICTSCKQINRGTSLDIIEIDAASHTGVDNVRDNIIASARIAMSADKYKVFIIDEAHMLSAAAFNALLKTLEEPPQRVVFILCTTEVHKMPTTIISRCQRFDLKRISVNDIVQKLGYIASKEEVKVARNILETIARYSGGHMRDAESLLGQIFSVSGSSRPDRRDKEISQERADLVIPRSNLQAVIDLIGFLEKKDNAQAIRLVNQLVDEGVDLKQFTTDLIENLRRMLLIKINPSLAEKFALDMGQILEEKARPIAQNLTVERLVEMLNAFLQAQNELKTSFIIQLPLEITIVTLCHTVPVKPLISSIVAHVGNPIASRPAPTNTVPQVRMSPTQTGSVKAEDVRAKWNEILLQVKKYNHSLSFILKVCEPRNIDGQLCLVFKYKFHKERVEQASIKSLLEKVLQEIFKNSVSFTTTLDENLEIANDVNVAASIKNGSIDSLTEDKKTSKKNKGVDNILKMFGGKVIK